MQGKQLYANISICVYSSFQCFPRGWCKRKYVYMLFLKSEGQYFLGFPDSSVGKESTCNAGDPGSIPGSGRSAEEGIGYPLWYSWASLGAQLVKNPPVIKEAWAQSLGWGRSPGEGKGYPLQYSSLENSMDCINHGVMKSWAQLSDFHNYIEWPYTGHLPSCWDSTSISTQ